MILLATLSLIAVALAPVIYVFAPSAPIAVEEEEAPTEDPVNSDSSEDENTIEFDLEATE